MYIMNQERIKRERGGKDKGGKERGGEEKEERGGRKGQEKNETEVTS